jgi:hypothetical protein
MVVPVFGVFFQRLDLHEVLHLSRFIPVHLPLCGRYATP